MKASDLFVECLEKEGVEVVFGIPGIETLDLMHSLSSSRIRFIAARQDCGAAYMADVYGRVAGKAGVCLAASGAASTNLVTGLAGATMDHSPVVAITGQRNLARIQREPYQVIDIVSTLRPVTKWNIQIGRPELIPECVHKAFKIAQTEPLGACHLGFPEDIAREEVTNRPFPPASLRRPAPPDRLLDGAAELIDNAKSIVVLAGNGAVRGDACVELASFVEELGLPVISTPNAKGVLPFDHPNFWYTVDVHCEEISLKPLREAEVVITVGYQMAELPPDLWNPQGKARIIHMSPSPSDINRNYMVSVEIVGDIRDSLRNLKMMVRQPKKLADSNPYKEQIRQTLSRYRNDNSFPVKPQTVVAVLGEVLEPEDLLICDMGSHRFWVSQLYPAKSPGSVVLSQSHNATGFALPGAIGAKVAQPDKRIVSVCGDGGFLTGCADLMTAVQLRMPLVVLVFNDRQLSYIRSLQKKRFHTSLTTEIANPDFVALAKSFGAQGIRLGQRDQLKDVLQSALSSGQTTVLEIPIDDRENDKIFDHWLQAK